MAFLSKMIVKRNSYTSHLKFIRALEGHLDYLRNKDNSDLVVVTDSDHAFWGGDFFGYLDNVRGLAGNRDYYTAYMIVNKMSDPTQFTRDYDFIIIPRDNVLDSIYNTAVAEH